MKIHQSSASAPIPQRASLRPPEAKVEVPVFPSSHRRAPRFFFIGFVLCACLLILFQFVLVPWWQGIVDQWHYGDSRVSHLSADVGHGGMSQFLAFDDDGHIVILEFTAHPFKAIAYQGASLLGDAQGNTIITMQVGDVNHDGKPDLIIQVEGQASSFVLFNTGSTFQWTSK